MTDIPIDNQGEGVAIHFGDRLIRLKWHRLRRRVDDPLFSLANLAQGLRLGASMEIDLRTTCDGHLAVLHDEILDRETTGTGRAIERRAADVRKFLYRDENTECRRPVAMDSDLAALLSGANPRASLQLDMKDDVATVGAGGVERLSTLFAPSQSNLVVSGDCTDLTLALAERMPRMRRGLEPSFRLLDLYRTCGSEALADQLIEELRAPIRPHIVYLAWKLIVAAMKDGVDLVRVCHEAGAEVDAWTFTPGSAVEVMTEEEWRNLSSVLETGVDQITTDDPIGLERAFRQRTGGG